MNSTESKHAFIVTYTTYSIVKKSFERCFSSLNIDLTIFPPCLESRRMLLFSCGIILDSSPPCKPKQVVQAQDLYATDQRVQPQGGLQR